MLYVLFLATIGTRASASLSPLMHSTIEVVPTAEIPEVLLATVGTHAHGASPLMRSAIHHTSHAQAEEKGKHLMRARQRKHDVEIASQGLVVIHGEAQASAMPATKSVKEDERKTLRKPRKTKSAPTPMPTALECNTSKPFTPIWYERKENNECPDVTMYYLNGNLSRITGNLSQAECLEAADTFYDEEGMSTLHFDLTNGTCSTGGYSQPYCKALGRTWADLQTTESYSTAATLKKPYTQLYSRCLGRRQREWAASGEGGHAPSGWFKQCYFLKDSLPLVGAWEEASVSRGKNSCAVPQDCTMSYT